MRFIYQGEYGLEDFTVKMDWLEEMEAKRNKLYQDYWQAHFEFEQNKSNKQHSVAMGSKAYFISKQIEDLSIRIEEYLYYKYS